MEICPSYWCAVKQYQCTAALDLAPGTSNCPVLLCKTAGWCHCSCTYTDGPFDEACLLPTARLYLYKCWVNAHLYEDQIPTGDNTLTKPCYRHVLHSSSEQWVWLPRAKLQCTGAGSLHSHEDQILTDEITPAQPCCGYVCHLACILPKAVVQCPGVESLHTCMKIKYENQVPTGDRSMLPCFHGNHHYDVFLCPTGSNAGVQLFFLFLGLSWFP